MSTKQLKWYRGVTLGFVAVVLGVTATASASSGSAAKRTSSTGIPAGVQTTAQLVKGTEDPAPTTGPKAKKGVFLVYLSCGQAAPGCSGPGKEAAKAAKIMGWRFQVIDGNFGIGGAFVTGLKQAVAEGATAIIASTDCNLAETGLQAAKNAHIPTIGYFGDDCNAQGAGPSLFTVHWIMNKRFKTIHQFFVSWGKAKADYLIRSLNGAAHVVSLNMTGSSTLAGAQAGFSQEMKKCSGCKVYNYSYPAASSGIPNGPVLTAAQSGLAAHPDANALVVPFDTQLLVTGLLPWFKNSQYVKKVTLFGGEGSPAGLQALAAGPAPVAEMAYSEGRTMWAAVDALNRYLNNAPQVPEGAGFALVSKSNLPKSGVYEPPYDYRAAYTKIWTGK